MDETLVEGRFADLYEVEAVQCLACAAREQAVVMRRQQFDGAPDYGTLFTVRRKVTDG